MYCIASNKQACVWNVDARFEPAPRDTREAALHKRLQPVLPHEPLQRLLQSWLARAVHWTGVRVMDGGATESAVLRCRFDHTRSRPPRQYFVTIEAIE